MKIIAKYFLLFILILSGFITFAQEVKEFKFIEAEGYYISLNGEKKYGLIYYVPANHVAPKLRKKYGYIEFRKEKGDKKEVIKPSECMGFEVSGYTFVPCLHELTIKDGMMDNRSESDFLQVIREGRLSLYYKYISIIVEVGLMKSNSYTGNLVVKKFDDIKYYPLPNFLRKKQVALVLNELFPGEEEVQRIFESGNRSKTIEALDAYNAKYKKTKTD